MRRTLAALLAVVVVVGTVAAVPAVGTVVGSSDAQSNTETQATTTGQAQSENASDANASISAGERLAGAVGVQEAELDGEIDSRRFGLAVARAETAEQRAALVAERLNETDRDLSDLQERRETLREARRNGSLSQGEFAARMAELVTRGQNVERTVEETANVSRGIPDDVLASRGVDVSALQTLREEARTLTGPEVAAIARDIAGPPADRGRDRAGDRAGDGDRGQREEAADRRDGAADGTETDAQRGDRSENRTDRAGDDQREAGAAGGNGADRSQRDRVGDETRSGDDVTTTEDGEAAADGS